MATGKDLNPTMQAFMARQPMFFVAAAGRDGRVNVSPKGMQTLRVIDDNRIVWLNLSGSGTETAAHVRDIGRMTLMFCTFAGEAPILRLYGTASVLHPRDAGRDAAVALFTKIAGSRQIFDLTIDLLQTACGSGVPLMDFRKSRAEDGLVPFYEAMGPEGVAAYWRRKNMLTIDGRPTGIFEDI